MLWIRTFLAELHAWQWLGVLLARLTVGLLFFLSGRGKLFVAERREQMRETLVAARVPFPELNALFVSTVEFGSGLLLIVGALTPIACVMLSGVMVMAIATTAVRNIKATSLLGWLSEFLYLPEVLCLVILLWLFFSGPGWFSIDHLILSQIHL
jgi:putative oxidoreductase